MTLSYDLYWSFRSPYSYFVTKRLVALERDYDVACKVRVVYPIAVRQPEFFDKNEAYHVLDRIQALDDTKIDKIMASHPKEWLTDQERDGIISWWNSDVRTSRIGDIRKGVKGGEYL